MTKGRGEGKRTYQDPSSEGVRRATVRERVKSDLSGRVLSLAESGAVVRAFKGLAVKVNSGLEPRRVVWTFPNASVGREVEAAPLGQLLKLVLVHFFSDSSTISQQPLKPVSSSFFYFLSSSSSTMNWSSRENESPGARSDRLGSGSGNLKVSDLSVGLWYVAGENEVRPRSRGFRVWFFGFVKREKEKEWV